MVLALPKAWAKYAESCSKIVCQNQNIRRLKSNSTLFIEFLFCREHFFFNVFI